MFKLHWWSADCEHSIRIHGDDREWGMFLLTNLRRDGRECWLEEHAGGGRWERIETDEFTRL
jgi:hypothetical protein